MRAPAFAVFVVLFTSLDPALAVQPSVAVIETLPVGNTETILLNVEEGGQHLPSPDGTYAAEVAEKLNGPRRPIKLKPMKLMLTTGDPGSTSPVSAIRIVPGRPAALVLRNLTSHKLRVTLQQPEAPAGAPAEEKAKFCTPTCKLDPAKYFADFCDRNETSPSRCKPKAGLANCGSAECETIRKACDKPDCQVDLYKALDACGCSVTKTLNPSTFREEGLKAARHAFDLAGKPMLQVSDKDPRPKPEDIVRFAEIYNVAIQDVKVEQVPEERLPDHPTVLFDAALFSGKEGLSVTGHEYRLLIEQDPPPPPEGGLHIATTTESVITVAVPPVATPPAVAPTAPTIVVGTPPTIVGARRAQTMRVVVVPLDDTGVANWRYLNPRNPACINCRPGGEPLPAGETPAGVVFRNRTQDRTFMVSLTLPATAPANAVDESFKCAAGQPCKITRSVAQGNSVLFDASILALFGKSLIKFEVSLYGETIALGNAAAYLSLSNPFDDKGKSTLTERPSATSFKTKLSLSGRVDPDIPAVPTKDQVDKDVESKLTLCSPRTGYSADNEPAICKERPYVDGNTQLYRGSGSVQLSANLSDRAEGSVTLSFRDGNYGAPEIDKTTVLDYQVSIFGTNGLSLKLGKTDFLVPSSGIAIAESGEGFLYSWRSFGLGHVVRRESTAGLPLQTNQDRKDWFFQARSLSIGQAWRDRMSVQASEEAAGNRPRDDVGMLRRALSHFRSVDLYAVRGEDKNLDSNYLTYGGEIFFARPASKTVMKEKETLLFNIFSGSAAAYRSSRDFDNDADCRGFAAPLRPCNDGQGHVWLVTVNWTPSMVIASGTNVATTPHTLSFVAGAGSGDNPGSGDEDEGYIGEPAGAVDRLFLKLFIPKMNSKNVPHEPTGLSNKRYAAITYTNSEWTLLDLVASGLRVREDVNSRSTIVALRDYRLRYGINGERGAAQEINVTFNIEVPKGVTFSLDASWLDPGAAYEDRITDSAWSFGANVTLSL